MPCVEDLNSARRDSIAELKTKSTQTTQTAQIRDELGEPGPRETKLATEAAEQLFSWTVDDTEQGRRLDVAVTSHLEAPSRARVKKWVEQGKVLVNGERARASRVCQLGETIQVTVPHPVAAEPLPERIPLDIVFEDEDLVVINKPAGLVVHPAPGHSTGTLVNALLSHCGDLSGIGDVLRPGIVHRLDAGTSGLMVVAKNDHAHRHLSTQFQDRTVEKCYRAIVHGVTPEHFVVDRAIGRDPKHRTRISSRSPRAKPARSEVERLESLPASSLISIRIRTGRTHQIRVHLSEAGFPVASDRDYGAPGSKSSFPSGLRDALQLLTSLSRPALHATSLGLDHPSSGERLLWECPLADDLAELLEKLRALRNQAD